MKIPARSLVILLALLVAPLWTSRVGTSAIAAPNASVAKQLAIYTGTFDPPTTGHLQIIRSILATGVGKLQILVNATSDSKDFKAASGERIEMLRAALGDVADRIELQAVFQDEKNDVVSRLMSRNPNSIQYIGQDSYEALPKVVQQDTSHAWGIIPRGGSSLPAKQPNISYLSVPDIEGASSTALRKELAAGMTSSKLLDPKVAAYIDVHNLYRKLPDELVPMQEKIFQQAFRGFVRDMQISNPKLELQGVPLPAFEPYQSREAWAEKFMNWVIKNKKFDAKSASDFRTSAKRILYVFDKGQQFTKIPFVELMKQSESGTAAKTVVSDLAKKSPVLSSSDHTLELGEYVSQRFPDGLQDFLNKSRSGVYFHNSLPQDALRTQAAQGFTEHYRVQISRGNPLVRNYLVRNPKTGEYRFVIPNMITEDRLAQVQGQIELFANGLSMHRAMQPNPPPTFTFNELGQKLHFTDKDEVVIGFKNVVFNEMSKHAGAWKSELISADGIDIVMYTDLKTGRRVVNPRNVYGDEMKSLLQTFYDKGARKFFMLGTAGALDPSIHIGDVLIPSSINIKPGETVHFENEGASMVRGLSGVKVHENVQHGWVQTILQETQQNAQRMQKSGLQSVDIEGRYLGEFLAQKKDVKGGMLLFVSDQPLGHIDYVGNNATLPTVQDSVKQTLDTVILGKSAPKLSSAGGPCGGLLPLVQSH